MTKIKVDKPFLPDVIEIETDVQASDASIRQSAGIFMNLVWESPKGEELGTKIFICEYCLRGTARPFHDKECLFAVLQV